MLVPIFVMTSYQVNLNLDDCIRERRENNRLLYEVNSYLKGDIYYEKSVENWY